MVHQSINALIDLSGMWKAVGRLFQTHQLFQDFFAFCFSLCISGSTADRKKCQKILDSSLMIWMIYNSKIVTPNSPKMP